MRFTWNTDALVSELYRLATAEATSTGPITAGPITAGPDAAEAQRLLAKALQADGSNTTQKAKLLQQVQALAGAQLDEAVLEDKEQELLLRSRPLRELFEARGPGLLHQLAKRTAAEMKPASVKPDSVVLWMVYPVNGGGGMPAGPGKAVIEAVLANPSAQLPETVRLAWLLACGITSEPASLPQPTDIGALALLPPLLEAAQEVELASYELSTLVEALQLWRVVPSGDEAASLAQNLWDWRESTAQQPWPQAVEQLRQRFSSPPG